MNGQPRLELRPVALDLPVRGRGRALNLTTATPAKTSAAATAILR